MEQFYIGDEVVFIYNGKELIGTIVNISDSTVDVMFVTEDETDKTPISIIKTYKKDNIKKK